jgi:very-short-patch-repair endonuclease
MLVVGDRTGRRSSVIDVPASSLATIARGQHGLVTRAQVLGALSSRTLERWVQAGRLEGVRRGVYRVGGAPETWEQGVLAACLAAGPASRASFRTAAALRDLEGFPRDGVEITHFGTRPSSIEGVVVHESTVFGPDHIAEVARIPTTSMARTLCDLTAIVPDWTVERAVDEALRRKLVTIGALRRVAEDLEGRGRMRCTVMRTILEHRVPGYQPAESAPERRIADLLVRAGLPAPVLQHRVQVGNRTYRIDLCYPDQRIAIEYDGWDFHRGRQAFDRDRARANDLVLLGMQVLRFTSRSSDQVIVDTVRTAYDRASRG